jgi:hypothetical protein
LNSEGEFTKHGRKFYLDDISGYVSYLNREKDARQFAQPIIEQVLVPMIGNMSKVEQFDKKVIRDMMESEIPKLKNQIIEKTKELDTEIGDLDANRFNFLRKEICGNLDGNEEKNCNKIVNRNIRDLISEAKQEALGMKTKINEVKQILKEHKEQKKATIKNIKENIEKYKEDYEKYKESVFYQLKNNCGKSLPEASKFDLVVSQHPSIVEFNKKLKEYNDKIEYLKEYDEKIEFLNRELNQMSDSYKNRMSSLKNSLKDYVTKEERNEVKATMADEKKEYMKLLKLKRKSLAESRKNADTNIKKLKQTKKKYLLNLKQIIKKKVNDDMRSSRKIEMQERKLRKTLRKQNDYNEELNTKLIKDLVKKYKEKSLDEYVEYSKGINSKAEEKRIAEIEKQKKAEEKVMERELKKLELQHKKEEKEKEKQTKKLEKEREKEARKTKKNMK